MIIQGLFLFLSGPYLASVIAPDLMEQASIWCFFSIAQITIMLFFIREALVTKWGRDTHHKSLLTNSSSTKETKDSIKESKDSTKGKKN
jgi:hypothetical protein